MTQTISTRHLISFFPLLACFSGLIIGYDTGIIGSALLFIQTQFHLTHSSQGIVASILILGVMLGILLTSFMSDRYPHQNFITFAAFIYLIGYFIVACAFNIFFIWLGRVLAGIAMGIIFVIVPPYLAEMAPLKLRGRFLVIFQLAITLGIFLGYLMSYGLAHYAAWRWMFILGLVGGSVLLFASFYLPHSPVRNEKIHLEKAQSIVYRRPFIIGMGLAILQQITGINAILYFAPQILLAIHPQSDTAAISSALLIAGGNVLFTIFSLFLLDSVGRRPVLIFSLFCQSAALALLAAISYLSHAEIFLSLACLLIYFFGFAIGLGPVTWLVIAEIYPSVIRRKAVGATVMMNNIAAFLVAGSFLTLLNKIGMTNIFWMLSGISLLGLLFVWWFVPETKRQSLEDIQLKFTKDSAQ